MFQGITRRATRRTGNRSPTRKPIRSSLSKSRISNRQLVGSNSSPTSRNQGTHAQPYHHCFWILSMLIIGFIVYAGVLKWSIIHAEREVSAIFRDDSEANRSSHSSIAGPANLAVPYPDTIPLETQFSTITSATKLNLRHTDGEASETEEIQNGKQQLSEIETRKSSHKTGTFHPRQLALVSTNDKKSTGMYSKVSNRIPKPRGEDPLRPPVEMILPIPNVTEAVPPDPEEPTTDQDTNEKADMTLSPVQQRKEQCIPQESWQTDYLINCNQLHELDMVSSSVQNKLDFLGQGWFRAAWKFSFVKYSYETKGKGVKSVNMTQEGLVMKTLRLEREFLDEYYELHRRDAVAMERLTWSPYVMDVYGYCGQSALNELAYFKEEINNLEQLDRAMRNLKQKDQKEREKVEYMKLKLATSVATGISHVHQVHSPSALAAAGRAALPSKPLMTHYDINPRNIAIVAGGKPKLNDFNIAEFIQYNPNNANQSCGFPSRLHEPWWRAPEEMYIPQDVEVDMRLVNEKVDVYALGAVLFHILTTHSPRGKMKRERMDEVREVVAMGVAPTLPAPYNVSDSPAVLAFRQALELCFVIDPVQRGSAQQVAKILQDAVKVYEYGVSSDE